MRIETIEFDLPLPAIGKPRQTRRDKWAKRPAVEMYREWADLLRSLVGEVPPADRVVSVDWIAEIATPRSWTKRRAAAAIGTLHRSKPDRDNVDKSILDALWSDDSGVAFGVTLKRWAAADRLRLRIRFTAEPVDVCVPDPF